MSALLVFQFPYNVTATEAIAQVVAHFERHDAAGDVPAHIKQAVEKVGSELIAAQDDPSNGVEVNPAIAFGGLANGGNVSAASFADAATSMTAQGANPDTSATSVPVSSPAVQAPVNAAVVPSAPAAPTSLANVDNTGLPWDARIHSEPAKLTDKGVWRKKRGVLPALVATVEAELRAIVGNAPTATPVVHAVSIGAPVFADGNAKKKAAIDHANATAKAIAGPQLIDDAVLQGLLDGKQTTLSPQQMTWYEVFYAARNDAFAQFMNTAQVAAPEVPPAPVVREAGVDATGLKWDARIHANPPAFDSSGVYVQRMDVAPETKLAIMAEMRGNDAVAQSTVPDTPVGSEPVVPPVPAAPVADDPAVSFVAMMKWIATNTIAKRITQAQIAEVAAMFGMTDAATGAGQISQAMSRPDMLAPVVETLRAYGAV